MNHAQTSTDSPEQAAQLRATLAEEGPAMLDAVLLEVRKARLLAGEGHDVDVAAVLALDMAHRFSRGQLAAIVGFALVRLDSLAEGIAEAANRLATVSALADEVLVSTRRFTQRHDRLPDSFGDAGLPMSRGGADPRAETVTGG